MKKTLMFLLVLAMLVSLAACSRGEGGAAGFGAGGGQSLREGSTAPLHSSIAQDQTYQKLLGLNILLYPPPVDDPKFEPFGTAHWDLDATAFAQAMKSAFKGQMDTTAVYEPQVDALKDDPLVAQIQEKTYNGEPVQVGWIYGKNPSLDYLEYNGKPVTLVTTEPVVLFLGDKAKLDTATWKFDTGNASAFYLPANAVVTINPEVLRSAPIRVTDGTGQLTAIITPQGVGAEPASSGSGMDQALVAKDRWIFALPGIPGGYYEGLTGSNKTINKAD
jgi:Domain of unknown function (DUF4867)